MKNRILYISSGIISLLTIEAGDCHAQDSRMKTPNIIFILADDLGYGDISPYGQKLIATPNLDKLAARGMIFNQCYAGSTVSAPSRASLMTGRHTGHTYIRGNMEIEPEGQCALPKGTFTLATLFKDKGYSTGAFGKWGLGYPGSESDPLCVGFDRFFGYNCQRKAHSYYPEYLWSDNQKVEYSQNLNSGRVVYSQDLIHEQALKFIEANKANPFFAYLAYTLPHAELNLPHDEVYQQYVEKFERDNKPFVADNYYYCSENPLASFAAMVTRLDKYVGDVVSLLDNLGISDNTVLFFTSDNGPHREGGADPNYFRSSGNLRGIKRELYEGGIRVPMIVCYPNKIPSGSISEQVIAHWDMMPTFADLIDSKTNITTDGFSIKPILLGRGRQKKHKYLYWEFHEGEGGQAVRMGDWKAIRLNVSNAAKTSLKLYNLRKDLHEDNNVAVDYPQKVKQFEKIMNTARTHSKLFDFGRFTKSN